METTSLVGRMTRFNAPWIPAPTWADSPRAAAYSPRSVMLTSTGASSSLSSTRLLKGNVSRSGASKLHIYPNDLIILLRTLDLRTLPGCNPIQNGPGQATMVENCTAPGAQPTATAPIPTTTVVQPTAPTSTTVVVPQPTAPQGPLIPKYGQCGGNGVSKYTDSRMYRIHSSYHDFSGREALAACQEAPASSLMIGESYIRCYTFCAEKNCYRRYSQCS